MATALKLRSDINKLKKALQTKGISDSVKSKLKNQLERAESELDTIKKTGKAPKRSSVKSTKTALTALQKLVNRKKYSVYKGAGVDLDKDAGQGALATGKRISKGLKANQNGDKGSNKGNVYYEYRPNRLDVKQPKKKQTYPKLEDGGMMAKGSIIDSEGGYKSLKQLNEDYKRIIQAPRVKNFYEESSDSLLDKTVEIKLPNEDKSFKTKVTEEYAKMIKGSGKYSKLYDKENIISIKKDGGMMADGGYMAGGGKVKVGDILTATTGVKVKVIEYDPKFGGRVRVERMDEYATGKPSQYMPLSKFKMASGGYMAKGGALEHGIEVGDKVVSRFNNVIVVENDGKTFVVNLNVGQRMSENEWFALKRGDGYKFANMAHGGNVMSTTHRMSK